MKTEEGKRWPQFLVGFSATLVVLTTGFHTGWPGPSLPKLLSADYPHDVSNEAASYITIIAYLGNICGGLVGAVLLDRIGRKKTILLIALPQFASFLLIATSHFAVELLYVARFVGGLAEGMTFTNIPLYLAEIAEPGIRGILGTLTVLTCISGMLIVNLVGSYLTIKTTATVLLVFPILFVLLFSRMPESPYFLLMKNRDHEAEAVLKFLRRKRNVDDELSDMAKAVRRQMSESGKFSDIFKIESNRRAFLLITGARVVQQFTGMTAFSLYTQILLGQATQTLAPHIGATILLLVQLFVSLSSCLFVDRWGRKPLLLLSTFGSFLNLLVQAIYFGLKEHTSLDLSAIDWFPLFMMVLLVIIFSSGLSIGLNILSSEIFSASIKSKAMCLSNVVFAASMMSTTKFYQATVDSFGLTVPFGSFAAFTFLGVLFFYFWLPETKGKTLEQIQQQLKSNEKR